MVNKTFLIYRKKMIKFLSRPSSPYLTPGDGIATNAMQVINDGNGHAMTVDLYSYKVPIEVKEMFNKFWAALDLHYRKKHKVQDYAELTGIPIHKLSQCVRLCRRTSPLKMINKRLIDEAKKLLTKTNRIIKNISYSLGYEEVSCFCRFFKNIVNMTPSEYRNKYFEVKDE